MGREGTGRCPGTQRLKSGFSGLAHLLDPFNPLIRRSREKEKKKTASHRNRQSRVVATKTLANPLYSLYEYEASVYERTPSHPSHPDPTRHPYGIMMMVPGCYSCVTFIKEIEIPHRIPITEFDYHRETELRTRRNAYSEDIHMSATQPPFHHFLHRPTRMRISRYGPSHVQGGTLGPELVRARPASARKPKTRRAVK